MHGTCYATTPHAFANSGIRHCSEACGPVATARHPSRPHVMDWNLRPRMVSASLAARLDDMPNARLLQPQPWLLQALWNYKRASDCCNAPKQNHTRRCGYVVNLSINVDSTHKWHRTDRASSPAPKTRLEFRAQNPTRVLCNVNHVFKQIVSDIENLNNRCGSFT